METIRVTEPISGWECTPLGTIYECVIQSQLDIRIIFFLLLIGVVIVILLIKKYLGNKWAKYVSIALLLMFITLGFIAWKFADNIAPYMY